MRVRKTWHEKMINPALPKIVQVAPHAHSRFGTGKILVPSPLEVDAYLRGIPRGSVATMSQMRRDLARKHAAESTCPLTSGLFVRIAAEAAEEDARAGKSSITPYWRMVKDDGSLNPKLPGGVRRQAMHLRAEGHTIVAGKGKFPPHVAMEKEQRRSNPPALRQPPDPPSAMHGGPPLGA